MKTNIAAVSYHPRILSPKYGQTGNVKPKLNQLIALVFENVVDEKTTSESEASRQELWGGNSSGRFVRRYFSYLSPFFTFFPHCRTWSQGMLVLHVNLNFATSMQIFEKLSLHVQIEIDYIRILLAGRRANLFSNTNSLNKTCYRNQPKSNAACTQLRKNRFLMSAKNPLSPPPRCI